MPPVSTPGEACLWPQRVAAGHPEEQRVPSGAGRSVSTPDASRWEKVGVLLDAKHDGLTETRMDSLSFKALFYTKGLWLVQLEAAVALILSHVILYTNCYFFTIMAQNFA